MQRQDGGVVDYGAMLGVVDDVHGDELRAEGHDVELSTHSLVGLHHLRDGLAFDPPPWELKHWSAVFLCYCSCWTKQNYVYNLCRYRLQSHPGVYM